MIIQLLAIFLVLFCVKPTIAKDFDFNSVDNNITSSNNQDLANLSNNSYDLETLALIRKIRLQLLQNIHQGSDLISIPLIENYTHYLGQKLLTTGNINKDNFQFYLIKSNELNAFAAADGIVVFSTKLINQLDNVDQLSAVMAHEIAHITQNHFSRFIKKNNRDNLDITLLVLGSLILNKGKISSEIFSTVSALKMQESLSYSRDLEWEADRLAINLLNKSGFDPEQLVEFLYKLDQYGTEDEFTRFLRTHPLTQSRIAEAKIRAKQAKNKKQKNYYNQNALIATDFNFYQVLVDYYSNEQKTFKNKQQQQLNDWLNQAQINNNNNIDTDADELINQIDQLIENNQDSRILPMLKVHSLLKEIEQNHQNSKKYLKQAQDITNFIHNFYPDYYPNKYYQYWLKSLNTNPDKASQIILALLSDKSFDKNNNFYFLSASYLAQKIALKYKLKSFYHFAKANEYKLKYDYAKAIGQYDLVIKSAKTDWEKTIIETAGQNIIKLKNINIK